MDYTQLITPISNVASSLFGALGGIGSSFLSLRQQKELMNNQYSLNLQGLKEGPLAQRQGLEVAGYNPLLGYIGASGASPSVSGGSAGSFDLSSSMTNAFKVMQSERKLANAQTENTNADTVLKTEQAESERKRQEQISLQNDFQTVQTLMARNDLSWRDRHNLSQYENAISSAILNRTKANLANFEAETGRIAANASQVLAESSSINAITNRKRQQDDRYSTPFKMLSNSYLDIVNRGKE